MLSLFPHAQEAQWKTLSFTSTLYLVPVLDILLCHIPLMWQAELRLGLQEALVNAASHGNSLDPSKKISVRFLIKADCWEWVICDQGSGFKPPSTCNAVIERYGLCDEQECGRGLYILHQIFDRVQWNDEGTELTLLKSVRRRNPQPRLS